MNKEEALRKIKELKSFVENCDKEEELFWGKYTIDNIEEAKKDENEAVRRASFRVLGFTPEAKKDKDWFIRLGAYMVFGYTEEALKDEDRDIREEAELYFRIQKARGLKNE